MNARFAPPTAPPASHPSVHAPWSAWRLHFERTAQRPLPEAGDLREQMPPAQARVVLEALARFQIGECGEGRIAREIHRAGLPHTDDDYAAALGLFIREEGRHARILASHIRGSGGQLLRDSWTRQVFSVGRRLAGPRTELVALMAAEIVGIAFYAEAARRLPPGPLSSSLRQIAGDETAHLDFHVAFFARQLRASPRFRPRFLALWMAAVGAGATLMVTDNRSALAALDIDPVALWRWQIRRAREIAGRVDAAAQVAPR